MVRSVVTCALLAYAGCKSESGADPSEVSTTSSPAKGSAGGFSASLSAELGSGSAKPVGSAASGSGAGSAAPIANGSGAGSAMAGSAAKAGSAAPIANGSGAGSAMAGSAAKAGSAAPIASGSGAGSGSAAKAGSAAPVASGSGSAVTPPPPPPKPKVVMTPELAAIKLSLQPNWDRDVEEPGSISLNVKVSGRDPFVFKFTYGYDEPKAPTDRDAYKKFLGDSQLLKVLLDRQSGASWYLEGTDATAHGAFRIVVLFGGKRLVCGGSLYKDSGLGDIRDEVLIQAKKICESIQL